MPADTYVYLTFVRLLHRNRCNTRDVITFSVYHVLNTGFMNRNLHRPLLICLKNHVRKTHLAQAQKFGNLLFQIWIFDSEANKSRQGVLLIYRQIRQLYFSTQSNAKAVSVSKSGFNLGYWTLLRNVT